MKRKIIITIFVVAVLGILAAALGYFFVYNKKHPNYEELKPDFSLEAASLFEAYRSDIAQASAMYNGKIVAVSGRLSAIDEGDGITVAVFAIKEGMFGDEGLRISMLPAHAEKLKQIAPGTIVSIKGYVTGYNETDVVFEHGSIISQ
jgi:hypothetical protein